MEVMKLCFKAGLYKQGLLHDLSKYSPAEFITGVLYYSGDKSPNTNEKLATGKSTAWLHHKGRNKHHFEYWIDNKIDGDKKMCGFSMPDKYIAEMFCDRVAACKVYYKEKYDESTPLKYFLKNHDHYMIHPDTKRKLFNLLRMLMVYGEGNTLNYIKYRFLK